MPKVTAQGKTFDCAAGANLRQVMLQNDVDLYSGSSTVINCRGMGSCGTCAVLIEGEVSEPNWQDKARRSLPPHLPSQNRRLACQTQVLGDVRITKFDGFWGQGSEILWTAEG